MKLFRYLLGRQCMLCGETVDPVISRGICTACEDRIAEERLLIPSGENRNTVAIYYYEDPVRRGLHRFKYRGRIEWGWFCGKVLAERYRERGEAADLITCVPRAGDGLPRLYNQSAVLGRRMAKSLGLPFDPHLLSKRRGMRRQLECPTPTARQENAKKAFRMGKSKRPLEGLRIILVDDLYTTGATANACCKLLTKAGAAKVTVYTACRVRPYNGRKLVIHYDRVHVHEEITDPTPYYHRVFRRRNKDSRKKTEYEE